MKFEDLVRILEEEKKSTLSRITPDFYSKVQEYIKEMEEADRKISRKHSQESIMIQYELKNALSTVDKIFNRRTRKIIKMASGKAFSKNPINVTHDIENMTPEERQVYQQVLDAILSCKKNTIEAILGTSNENEPVIELDIKPEIQPAFEPGIKSDIQPVIPGIKPDSKPSIKSGREPDITSQVQDTDEHMVRQGNAGDEVSRPIPNDSGKISGVPYLEPINEKQDISGISAGNDTTANEKSYIKENETPVNTPPTHKEEIGRDTDENGKKDLNKEYIVVRLLKNIPKFIGANGRNYRLGAQDVVVLPKVNANALIKRKVAVEIEIPYNNQQ
jgi:DNA replication initiation complex subunit (GINS family)